AAVAGLLGWCVQGRRRAYSTDWIGRSLAFTVRQARGELPELERQIDRHAARLAQRLREGLDDEVLVVGHSSGTMLAVAIVARALAQLEPAGASRRPGLSLLTLGQCIPTLGLLPPAQQFRRELLAVATCPDVHWVDFSAPPDACCFPLVDPLQACGIARPAGGAAAPLLLSPRFSRMFEAGDYARRKRDKFGLHFQYLMASDRPAGYDYFAITAGRLALAQRYGAVAARPPES
ncbi:MAG TPA: hypothetical protein VFE74_08970, partial [Ramlibacter sp.]|nr:hypothetical protein [Ramlibacter sp.]